MVDDLEGPAIDVFAKDCIGVFGVLFPESLSTKTLFSSCLPSEKEPPKDMDYSEPLPAMTGRINLPGPLSIASPLAFTGCFVLVVDMFLC